MRLNDRFFEFCRQYPGAEDLDAVEASKHFPRGSKVADFLFEDGGVVSEVKTFTAETSEKLANYMDSVGIGPSQLRNGQHSVRKLFLALDDGEAKYRKAITLATTPISDGLDDAEKQIHDTKVALKLPNADGLLIVLNDEVILAGPSFVKTRIEQRLARTAPDGAPYHGNVSHILYICEKYTPGEDDAYLNLSLRNPLVPERNALSSFAVKFMTAWAQFNGQSFMMAEPRHEKALTESDLVINVGRRHSGVTLRRFREVTARRHPGGRRRINR